jgi:hypothetical protein
MSLGRAVLKGVVTLVILGVLIFVRHLTHRSPEPFDALPPDRTVVASSKHPVAVDVLLVGHYPALTKSGAGYFYDDVLEYRVWMKPAGGGDSFYRAFASFETALEYSKKTPNSEEPLVLIRQIQWIDEPQPGVFHAQSGERIAEWEVEWLATSKRSEDSIARFLKEHRKPR